MSVDHQKLTEELSTLAYTIAREERNKKEEALASQPRYQPGIGFPAASKQKSVLIVRLNLLPGVDAEKVRRGLRRLCGLFARIYHGQKAILFPGDERISSATLPQDAEFTATIGFGAGFFEHPRLRDALKTRPGRLNAMPSKLELGDSDEDKPEWHREYALKQTDLILQLCASDEYINYWVLENISDRDTLEATRSDQKKDEDRAEDIVSAIFGWATIVDSHIGFQRPDERNLMGFNDGSSNPRRLSPLFDKVVWTTADEEAESLQDGTYMVFQKITHDLDLWRTLKIRDQERWIGRHKGTGLMLGTLPAETDERLNKEIFDPHSLYPHVVREWREMLKAQAHPTAVLYGNGGLQEQSDYPFIAQECPAWSHVRKSNPRGQYPEYGLPLIFRRSYLFFEPQMGRKPQSGILFICFQRDIEEGFQKIKQVMLNNRRFPVDMARSSFTTRETEQRDNDKDSENPAMETGREALAGPSINGVAPEGQMRVTDTLGGGYYFIPPVPNADLSRIGQQFFE